MIVQLPNTSSRNIASGQSNFTKEPHIAAEHGRLNCIRQVAPMCTPPHVTHPYVGRCESTTQTASRLVQPFLDSSRQCRRACPGMSFPLKKLSLRMRRSGLPSNTWFLDSTKANNPNGISIGSAVFAGLITVTDRQTDTLLRL